MKVNNANTQRQKAREIIFQITVHVYLLRQEAILAAISEKDAHIAILETSGPGPSKHTQPERDRLNQEKRTLQQQLKQLVSLTHSRNKHTLLLTRTMELYSA